MGAGYQWASGLPQQGARFNEIRVDNINKDPLDRQFGREMGSQLKSGGEMNIDAMSAKPYSKSKTESSPTGSKINYTCKKCKPLSIAAPDGIQSAENGDPPTPSQDRPANVQVLIMATTVRRS